MSEREAWEREAEDNVLRRLEKSALLAPNGEVDEVRIKTGQALESGDLLITFKT